jgi:hypothetical protein
MALSLLQLVAPQPVATWRSLLLGALQGLGLVLPGGTAGGGVQTGTGTLALSGTPAAAYTKIVVKIVTAGELGAGVFQYSLDGGTTYSGNVTIPASPGAYVLSTTGVTITFAAGPTGGPTSFAVGDTFTFALNVPSLGVTSWQSGGAYRTLAEIEAQALADYGTTQSTVAASGFLQAWLNPSSMGLSAAPPDAWLDLLGVNVYGLTRTAAVATQGLATLTAAAAAGPYTITAGTMWIADSAGRRYSNVNGGTLGLGGTLQLTWQAESPGASYNVANGTLTSIVAGTLAGVTVNNPDPGSGTWVTTQGADAESNVAYATRCQNRWPSLAAPGTSPSAQYQLWALSAEAAAGHGTTITKTLVIADATIPGQVDVYLAGASGAAGGGAVTDANTYIQARVGITNTAVVAAASNVAITVAGTVNYYASQTTLTAVTAAVAAALAKYFGALGISDGTANFKVYWTQVEAAVAGVVGIRNVVTLTTNGGTADIALTLGQVATLTNSLTFTSV